MAAALFDYVGTLYSLRIEASNDPSPLLAVYRALVRHLAVFGVEIVDPALYPQLIAEYATPAEGAAAAGRGGDDVIDGLLSVRLAARRVRDFAKADAMRNLLNEVSVHIDAPPRTISDVFVPNSAVYPRATEPTTAT